MKNTLRHQPTGLRRVALESIEFIRRAFLFRPWNVFHRIARTMAVTGAAQHTAASALIETLGIEPFLDSLEPWFFFGFVFHFDWSVGSANELGKQNLGHV